DLAIFLGTIEVTERREHRDRRIERVAVSQAAHVPLDERRLDAGLAGRLPGLRQEGRRQVEARHPIPALRELDRMAARPACDVHNPSGLPELEDLVHRLGLARGLRAGAPAWYVGSRHGLLRPA